MALSFEQFKYLRSKNLSAQQIADFEGGKVPEQPKPKQGFWQEAKDRAMRVGSGINEGFTGAAQRYDEATARGDKGALGKLALSAAAIAPRAFGSAIVEGVKQVMPDEMKSDFKAFGASVVANPEIQGKIIEPVSAWAKQHPDLAQAGQDVLDIASVLPAPKFMSEAAKASAKAAEEAAKAANAGKGLIPAVVEQAGKFKAAQKTKADIKLNIARTKAYDEFYKLTQGEMRDELKSGKAVIADLRDSGVVPKTIKDASGTERLANGEAIDALVPKRDAAFATMQEALTKNPKTFDYSDFQKKAIENFKERNKAKLDDDTIIEAVAQIKKQTNASIVRNAEENLGFTWEGSTPEKKIKFARENNPAELKKAEVIDAVTFNNNKAGFWAMGKLDHPLAVKTPKNRIATTMGATVKDMIETAYKGEAKIKELNAAVAKYSEMIHWLERSEGRIIPKGSALRGMMKRATGAVAGAVIGSAVPIPGAGVVGAMIGEKLGGAMIPGSSAKLKALNLKAGVKPPTE